MDADNPLDIIETPILPHGEDGDPDPDADGDAWFNAFGLPQAGWTSRGRARSFVGRKGIPKAGAPFTCARSVRVGECNHVGKGDRCA
jgi:hypothetical protein